MANAKPRIVLTAGEPAGIGPDLCLSVAERDLPCELIVAGDRATFEARRKTLGKSISIVDYDAARPIDKNVLTLANIPARRSVVPGKLDAENAAHVLGLLNFALDGCLNSEFAAMVTAPIQKSVINDAGTPFSGHTEYLAERCGVPLPVMMLIANTQPRPLRVALATTHLPLSKISTAISLNLLADVVAIIDTDLRRRFRLTEPNILVCGLNPHAGESGHLGREEIETIIPAVNQLRAKGICVTGPVPADTAFTPHMLADCDAVLAMYHDQGLPVLKYAGFGHAVNVTLGLPIIRTSVDHGTALDLAGTGKADAGSLIAAIEMAIELAGNAKRVG